MKKVMYVLVVILLAAVAWNSVLAQDAPGCGAGGPCPSPTWWPPCDPSKPGCATATPEPPVIIPPVVDPPVVTVSIWLPLIEAWCKYWPYCVVPDGPLGGDPYPPPATPMPEDTPVPGAPEHR